MEWSGDYTEFMKTPDLFYDVYGGMTFGVLGTPSQLQADGFGYASRTRYRKKGEYANGAVFPVDQRQNLIGCLDHRK